MVHVAEATNCFTVEYCLTAGNDWICRTCIDEEGSRGLMTDEIASGIRADAVPLRYLVVCLKYAAWLTKMKTDEARGRNTF